jgi:hypothetical protein
VPLGCATAAAPMKDHGLIAATLIGSIQVMHAA